MHDDEIERIMPFAAHELSMSTSKCSTCKTD